MGTIKRSLDKSGKLNVDKTQQTRCQNKSCCNPWQRMTLSGWTHSSIVRLALSVSMLQATSQSADHAAPHGILYESIYNTFAVSGPHSYLDICCVQGEGAQPAVVVQVGSVPRTNNHSRNCVLV